LNKFKLSLLVISVASAVGCSDDSATQNRHHPPVEPEEVEISIPILANENDETRIEEVKTPPPEVSKISLQPSNNEVFQEVDTPVREESIPVVEKETTLKVVSDSAEIQVENNPSAGVSEMSESSAAVEPPQPPAIVLSDFEKLRQRIVPDFIDREIDRALKESTDITILATEYINLMGNSGEWKDIDYQTAKENYWPADKHLQRMRTLAAVYLMTSDDKYKSAVINALEYWVNLKRSDYLWSWYQQVMQAQPLAVVALILGDELPDHLKQYIVELLPNQIDPTSIGINRSHNLLGVLYRGLLSEDGELVGATIKNFENSVRVTTNDGIQPDWSFHRNGPQLYVGIMEEYVLESTLQWARRVHDLEWKFSQKSTEILAHMVLDGLRWMHRSGQIDYNVVGRSIARPSSGGSGIRSGERSFVTPIEMLFDLVPERLDEVLKFYTHFHGDPDSGLNGFKHFWRSDYTVTATNDFTFSIKMNSKRTEPTENGNGENLLGYWLGFGSTFLMQSGDEYHDIFPVLDWTKIPGVTAPEYKEAPYYYGNPMQDVSFVGGATNGQVGVTTMVLDMSVDYLEQTNIIPERANRTQLDVSAGNTQAKKSWFSFGDQIVALGAGIRSTHNEPVNTTINQTLYNNNAQTSLNGALSLSDHDVSHSRWVYHDHVGYVFFDDSPRIASVKTQTGTWSEINNAASDTQIFKDVFTLLIPHGVKPENSAYQYVIIPGRTKEQVADYQANIPLKVLHNSEKLQAVEDTTQNIVSAVFYQAGELAVSSDFTVKVDKPSVVILERGLNLKVTVSTPGEAYSSVAITVTDHGVAQTKQIVTPGTPEQMGNSVSFEFI